MFDIVNALIFDFIEVMPMYICLMMVLSFFGRQLRQGCFMIYVPEYSSGNCAYMQSNNVLRVYDTKPTNNSTINYRDYMVDNHYLYRDGTTNFSNYSTLPTCLSDEVITQNYGYRTDIADILLVFVIILGICYFIISKLISSFFRGWK